MKLGEAVLGLRTELSKFSNGINSAQNKIRTFGTRMKANATQMRQAGLAIGVVSAALIGLGTKGTMEIAKFQRGIANVATMLDETSLKRLPQFQRGVRDMAVGFGEGTDALTKGLYDILSAGIESGKAMGVLETSVIMAKAGLTDTGIAADAVTTILNSYRLSAEQAGDVSDWMFAIVRKGKTTMAELAPTIGRIASMGAVAGLSMNDMGAALATMTRAGLKTDEAVTSLRGVLRAFISPTNDAKEAAAELGIELSSDTLRTQGLIPVVRTLSSATDEQKGTIFGNVRAFTGVATIIQDVTGYTNDLTFMQERAGLTQEAFAKQTDTLAFRFAVLRETINEVWRIIGENLLPFVTPMIEKFREALLWIASLPEPTKQFAIQLGMLVGVIGAVTAAVMMFVGSLLLIPGAQVVVIIGLIVAAIAGFSLALEHNTTTVGRWATALWTTVKGAVELAMLPIEYLVEFIGNSITAIINIIQQPWQIKTHFENWKQWVSQGFDEIGQKAERTMDNMAQRIAEAYVGASVDSKSSFDSQKSEMDKWAAKFGSMADQVINKAKGTFGNIKNTGKNAFDGLNNATTKYSQKQSQAVSNLQSGFGTFFRGILQGGKTVFESLADVASFTVGLIIQAISKAIAQAIILGNAIKTAQAGGIPSAAGAVAGGGLLGGIVSALPIVGAIGIAGTVLSSIFGRKKEERYVPPEKSRAEIRAEKVSEKQYLMKSYRNALDEADRMRKLGREDVYQNMRNYAVSLGQRIDEITKQGFKYGGIVTRPTIGLLGEAGPEAVIPLPEGMEFSPGFDGGVRFGDVIVEVNIDKLATDNIIPVMRRISEAVKDGIPEGIRLAKTAFKVGRAYEGEAI